MWRLSAMSGARTRIRRRQPLWTGIKNVECLEVTPCSLFCLTLLCVVVGCRPPSQSEAFILNTYFDLLNYAQDHGGWFPTADNTNTSALQKLYPGYCNPGMELAGLSGDIDGVEAALNAGQPLTDKLTSWVYVQGLRKDDDQNLAILWERTGGLSPNGTKHTSGGHAVLFLSGDRRQIPELGWTNFLREQESLRKTAIAKRPPKA
jgi:hypothetical protein